LQIDLALDDAILRETAFARIVIERAAGFPAAPLDTPGPDRIIRNVDLRGDGRHAIVADLAPVFPFQRERSYLKVAPSSQTVSDVSVAVEVVNRFGNPVGLRLGLATTLPGGSLVAEVPCTEDCANALTRQLAAPLEVDPGAHAVGALVVRGELVAVGVPEAGDELLPARGLIKVYRADPSSLTLIAQAAGAAAGDRLGEALALGDFDGDGQLDLAAGAPGAADGRGQALVLFGPLPDPLPLAGAAVAMITGGPRQFLGGALAVADADGDGRSELVVGAAGVAAAPGLPDTSAGAVVILGGLQRGQRVDAPAPALTGPLGGARLGLALDARGGWLAAAAPGAGQVLAARLDDLIAARQDRLVTWSSAAPGFGAALLLTDEEADGRLELVAGTADSALLVAELPDGPAALDDAAIKRRLQASDLRVTTAARISTATGDRLGVAGGPGQSGAVSVGVLVNAAAGPAAGPNLSLAPGGPHVALSALATDAAVTRIAGRDNLFGRGAADYLFGDARGRLYTVSLGGNP
jgi:hypothetical protein